MSNATAYHNCLLLYSREHLDARPEVNTILKAELLNLVYGECLETSSWHEMQHTISNVSRSRSDSRTQDLYSCALVSKYRGNM